MAKATRIRQDDGAACESGLSGRQHPVWRGEIHPARARLGLLVPFTNTNFEPDMALLMPPGITLHAARMGGYDEDEIPDEAQMAGLGAADLDEPLALLVLLGVPAVLHCRIQP